MIFRFSIFLLLINCAAFSKPRKDSDELIIYENIKLEKKINLEFYGFHFYTKEETSLRANLEKNQFIFSKEADLILQVYLIEKKPNYKHDGFHFFNLIISILSSSVIPYYTESNHELKIKFFDKNKLVKESKQELVLSQFRGIILIPFTFFLYPSSIFKNSINESLEFQMRNL